MLIDLTEEEIDALLDVLKHGKRSVDQGDAPPQLRQAKIATLDGIKGKLVDSRRRDPSGS